MPACCSLNRPPHELLDRLIDEIAWAKTCLLVAAAAAPGSDVRDRELAQLRKAVINPRTVVDDVLGKGQALPREILVELRTCEMAIAKLEAGAVLR